MPSSPENPKDCERGFPRFLCQLLVRDYLQGKLHRKPQSLVSLHSSQPRKTAQAPGGNHSPTPITPLLRSLALSILYDPQHVQTSSQQEPAAQTTEQHCLSTVSTAETGPNSSCTACAQLRTSLYTAIPGWKRRQYLSPTTHRFWFFANSLTCLFPPNQSSDRYFVIGIL